MTSREIIPRSIVGADEEIKPASILTTREDVVNYRTQVNEAISGLYIDIRNNLVYADPDSVSVAASKADVWWPGKTPDEVAFADKLKTQAAELKTRAAGRSADQIKKEIEFSTAYGLFYDRWVEFEKTSENFYGSETKWMDRYNQIINFHKEYREWRTKYQSFGFEPSNPDPKPPTRTGLGNALPGLPGLVTAIETVAIVGAVGIGAYFGYQYLKK